MKRRFAIGAPIASLFGFLAVSTAPAQVSNPAPVLKRFHITRADYADRVGAVWYGQLLAVYLTLQFEHKTAAVEPINGFPQPLTFAFIDDDWYYEMCAVRAFEKYGVGMTADQLGQQWIENNCGAWGSSEAALKNLKRGIKGSESGHPRYNRFWWTIGPVFSSDLYGALAPAMPNLAGRMAREFGHINGYAESVDGAVIFAGAISIGFTESDPKKVLREAVQLVDTGSPYRQGIEMVIKMADAGHSFEEIVAATQDRWRPIYPQSNNAVANGAIAAACLWFGEADFWKTVNLASRAADFTDTDNSAASAIAVIGAMRGMAAMPAELVSQLGDRLAGEENNNVMFTPPVDERISDLVKRTTAIGEKIIIANGGQLGSEGISIIPHKPVTQLAEKFTLSDLMRFWNPDWTLERAGFGGIHGGTSLSGEVLATFPQDEARGLVLRRKVKPGAASTLSFEAAADPGQAWELAVYVGNKQIYNGLMIGDEKERAYKAFEFDLSEYAGHETALRIYQKVLNLGDHPPGRAFWKNLSVK